MSRRMPRKIWDGILTLLILGIVVGMAVIFTLGVRDGMEREWDMERELQSILERCQTLEDRHLRQALCAPFYIERPRRLP